MLGLLFAIGYCLPKKLLPRFAKPLPFIVTTAEPLFLGCPVFLRVALAGDATYWLFNGLPLSVSPLSPRVKGRRTSHRTWGRWRRG